MSKEFEAGKDVLESGLYKVIHNELADHPFGLLIEQPLYKGDKFPHYSCCNPKFLLNKSKSDLDSILS